MIWTHIYDLLLKLITIIFSIFFLIQIPYLEDKGLIVIILSISLFLLIYNLFVRTFATYLYCRFTLKMNIDLAKAKQLNNAYSPVFPMTMKWLPMTELKNIDDTNKFQIALDTYKNWEDHNKLNRKKYFKDFNNAGKRTKILTIMMYLLVGYFMIAGFMNLPPANYLTKAYCKLFDTENYYPILNCLLLVLATLILFKCLDKNIKL